MPFPNHKSPYLKQLTPVPIAMWVVHAVEVHAPKDVERVEWILLTSLPVTSFNEVWRILEYCEKRWLIELVYDEQKTHNDPRRPTRPAHLRSETPAGVIQEVYALSLGHFVIRALMFEAAQREHLDPDRFSFTGCFQILQCRLPECDTRTPQSFEQWHNALL